MGFAAEVGWQGEGVPHFDYVETLIERLVTHICTEVGATKSPLFFFTGKTNFRNALAKRQKYKDRVGNKPFHYHNIQAYIQGKWDWFLTEGLEADDLMSIAQTESNARCSNEMVDVDGNTRTIICSRDKDLLGTQGWSYSWELANQPSFGPDLCEGYGSLELREKRHPKDPVKIKGRGDKFFLSQCITGDVVDTVPGLAGKGPAFSFKVLGDTTNYQEGLEAVLGAYRAVYGDDAEKELTEQARLLYMSRVFKDNKVLLWSLPNLDYEEWMDVRTMEIERVTKV